LSEFLGAGLLATKVREPTPAFDPRDVESGLLSAVSVTAPSKPSAAGQGCEEDVDDVEEELSLGMFF